jgi:hypothetical protein
MAQTEARNRQDLERALSAVISELLNEKGYICFVDVLMKLGYLSKSDYENWRLKRVSPLERILNVNLSRINFIMKTVRRNSLNGHLKPSLTVCGTGDPTPHDVLRQLLPTTRLSRCRHDRVFLLSRD